jgi:glycosyl transferase family 1
MKIGFFGNTNNYPFRLAQVMRDLGHEVLLVVTSQELLHRPEGRCPEFATGYPDWILDAAHHSELDFMMLNPSLAPLLNLLSSCDALILNGLGPSLSPLLNRPAIAMLTGSDLEYYADFSTIDVRTANYDPAYKASPTGQTELNLLHQFIQRQREGITAAVAVRYFPRGLVPAGDKMLDDLDVPNSKRIFLPCAEIELIKPTPAPHNDPVRIFCATRLTWKLPIEPGRSLLDYKGSDVMVRGLGLFYRQSGVRLDIQLVRKGMHLPETEDLISEEGLTDQVTWSPEMSLAQVWSEFARCDIVIEQLTNNAIGGAGLDAMAAARPVIGNTRTAMFEGCFGQTSPIFQAQTAEEVCQQLTRLVFDRQERQRAGEHGRKFVEEHCSPRSAAHTCLELLRLSLSDKKSLNEQNGSGYEYCLQRFQNDAVALKSAQERLHNVQEELLINQAELENNLKILRSAKAELERNRQMLQTTRQELEVDREALKSINQRTEADRQALKNIQQQLERDREILQNTTEKLARYENCLPIHLVRKIRRLLSC